MHRLLVIGATSFVALVLAGPAVAWSWPADGDVLQPFALGGDAYAAGQHRGIDVAGPAGSSVRAPASGTAAPAPIWQQGRSADQAACGRRGPQGSVRRSSPRPGRGLGRAAAR